MLLRAKIIFKVGRWFSCAYIPMEAPPSNSMQKQGSNPALAALVRAFSRDMWP